MRESETLGLTPGNFAKLSASWILQTNLQMLCPPITIIEHADRILIFIQASTD